MLFDTLDTVTELMRKAMTSTGLRTTVNVIRRIYESGRNATNEMQEFARLSTSPIVCQTGTTLSRLKADNNFSNDP